MNAKLTAALAAATAIAAAVGYGAYWVGMDHGMAMAPAAPAPIAGGAERKVLYWHDPMVPGHRFDKPGKSPFMDMQLVPVYADEAQGPGVTVNPAMTQNLGIRTAAVTKGPMAAAVEAVGTVVQNERATVVVQSRVVGYVEKLYVRAVLDPVAKDQPLVTIFAPDWSGALTEYLGLRSANLDPAIVSAARERLRLLSIPDDVVARSEREGAAQSRFTLTSPIAGVVGELGTREGAMVQPGMALFRIVDLSSVWVETNVPEAQAAHVRVGAAAEVKAEAYPGRAFAGKVGAILPQVDATTRTLRARIELRNPGTVLKPGMFVSVSLRSGDSGDVLLVPQEAVITTGKRTVVIVAGDNNRFIPAEVTLGHAAGSAIEVRTGLAEGQRVVTSGQFLIDSEASLKSTLSRLDAGTSVVAQGTSAAVPARHRSEGRVEKIGKEELTVSHEPIPALKWPSMTMGFKHPAAGLPPGLRVGDRVRFEFVERKGGYQLTNVERIPGPGNKP